MKMKLLSITLFIGICLLINSMAWAQYFPETGAAQTCNNCVPSLAYSIVSGAPYVSDRTYMGSSSSKWYDGNFIKWAPAPPSSSDPNSINFKSQTFLTLMKGTGLDTKVKFTVSNFIPGQKYKLNYAVMASRTSGTSFGTQAIVQVQPSNSQVILATAVSDLTAAKYVWLKQTIEFTPTTTETVFVLSGNAVPGEVGMINFDISSHPLDCILPVNKQVDLTHPTQELIYPCSTVDLENHVKLPMPTGATVVWGYGQLTNTPKIASNQIHAVGAGTYYAFYYHLANNCYSLQGGESSTSKVEVNYVPKQVPLKIGSYASVKCPETEYYLETKLLYPSDNSAVRWFNNNKRQGSHIAEGYVTSPGTYYAFYYNSLLDCYSVETSTAAVSVLFDSPCCQAGTAQVSVQSAAISNTCPAVTADLTTTVLNVPPNTQLVWFDNPTHNGSAITNPTAVVAGTYYAFFYDPIAECYNTDNSTAQVKVTTTSCASNVQLGIKVALQGAMPQVGAKMRNELQIYGGTGLLPTVSPYTVLSSYPNINNVSGGVGEVVDWVFVEIRNGSSPQTVLQSASLLLKPDGTIVDRNGLTPKFNAQAGPVRVVVKHRNHLAIMSNPIQNFGAGSTISYDFTTALSQASNAFVDPPQMVQKNGVWCMWAGDLNASPDLIVDGADGAYFKSRFNAGTFDVYDRADVNMDGIVDGLDGSLFKFNFLTGKYSSLINY